MEVLLALFALLLPALTGGLLLSAFAGPAPARAWLVWGNGALLGLLLVPQLMRLQDALGLALGVLPVALPCAVMALVAGLLHFTPGRRAARPAVPAPACAALSRLQKALFAVLAALVVLRLGTLWLEVWWRPLYPWDATMHWATKAKVWFEHRHIVPFVDNAQWLERGGSGVYTDRNPGYPGAIPLLQVWMNLVLGRWHESLMNLPWVLCFAALGGAFYGQLRLAGLAPLMAMVFTYMLLTMPLLNTHVALAGYADLFLAAAYCAAVMALHNWSVKRQGWLLALALAYALACPTLKNEGLIWAGTLIPALAAAVMTRRETAKLFLCLFLWGVLALLVIPDDLDVIGHSIKAIRPSFSPEGLVGTVKTLLLHANWHLFGYLLLAIVPIGMLMPGAMLRRYLGLSLALGSAVALYLFLFVFTGFGLGAADFTGVGRLSIQLVPALLFLCALLVNDLFERGQVLAPAPYDSADAS